VLLAMVRIKGKSRSDRPVRGLRRPAGATKEMRQERTFLRPQPDPGIRRWLTPLPTIADREETQRCHRDGNKDENPNEAKPN
jgi:hypothetical protein